MTIDMLSSLTRAREWWKQCRFKKAHTFSSESQDPTVQHIVNASDAIYSQSMEYFSGIHTIASQYFPDNFFFDSDTNEAICIKPCGFFLKGNDMYVVDHIPFNKAHILMNIGSTRAQFLRPSEGGKEAVFFQQNHTMGMKPPELHLWFGKITTGKDGHICDMRMRKQVNAFSFNFAYPLIPSQAVEQANHGLYIMNNVFLVKAEPIPIRTTF